MWGLTLSEVTHIPPPWTHIAQDETWTAGMSGWPVSGLSPAGCVDYQKQRAHKPLSLGIPNLDSHKHNLTVPVSVTLDQAHPRAWPEFAGTSWQCFLGTHEFLTLKAAGPMANGSLLVSPLANWEMLSTFQPSACPTGSVTEDQPLHLFYRFSVSNLLPTLFSPSARSPSLPSEPTVLRLLPPEKLACF